MLEERDAVSGAVNARYVWSPVYVDAMVLRDRDTDADGVVESTSAGDERLYVLQDANFNITALVDDSGTVIERYLYDPYGERTVIDADWSSDADGDSDVDFVHGHQGGRHDLDVGLIHFRFRDTKWSLGRWTRQDPAGYVDGAGLYQSISSNPTARLDPLGMFDIIYGTICNYGSTPLVIWSTRGYMVLGPGDCTAAFDDWDYALVGGIFWVKVRDCGLLICDDEGISPATSGPIFVDINPDWVPAFPTGTPPPYPS